VKCKVTTTWPNLEEALADLLDENGECDTEVLNQRLCDLGVTMWPTSISFGELDYTSSEDTTIELTTRYSEKSYSETKETLTSSDTTLCNEDSQQQVSPVGIYEWLDTLSLMHATSRTFETEETER
jgi:hypothetical protein